MSKERELLRRAQRFIDNGYLTAETLDLSNDIDEYLSTARNPMTEEEIAACVPPQPKDGLLHMVDGRAGVVKEWVVALARAIEWHHGIEEKQ